MKITSPPQSHLGRVHRYPSQQRMHSSAACDSCAVSTAGKSSYSYSAMAMPHLCQSLDTLVPNLTITLTLLTTLIQLQPPASILQA